LTPGDHAVVKVGSVLHRPSLRITLKNESIYGIKHRNFTFRSLWR